MSVAKRLCAEESEAKVAAIQARDEQDVRLEEAKTKLSELERLQADARTLPPPLMKWWPNYR